MNGCVWMLCISLLSVEDMSEEKLYSRADNCEELWHLSEEQGLDPLLMLAISHTESRFNKKAKSRAGAMGMMQVLPRYFCPKKGPCDYTAAGFKAWKAWSKKRGNKKRSIKEALCRYNSGQPCSKSPRASYYAKVVLRKFRLLRIEYSERQCEYEPGC